jgi:inner membrane protein YhjD
VSPNAAGASDESTGEGASGEPPRADNLVNRTIDRADRLQQRWAPAGFTVAALKKFGDDRGGNHCALISYYGFFALFPLLLAMVTILGYVLEGNPELQQRVVDSTFSRFPVIGDQLRQNVGSIKGNWFALVVGIGLALWAGLGATQAGQDAMNEVFGVPLLERKGYLVRQLRGLETLAVIGVIILATTALGSGSTWVHAGGWLGRIGYVAAVLVVNGLSVFALINVLCHERQRWRKVWSGAVVAAFGWTVLQFLGSWYVGRVVKNATQTYGVFATVIGLLTWIYLQARIFVLAAEVATVADGRFWPRALVREHPTDADVAVADLIAAREDRMRDSERARRAVSEG